MALPCLSIVLCYTRYYKKSSNLATDYIVLEKKIPLALNEGAIPYETKSYKYVFSPNLESQY